eukprot:577473-Pyramimonas_sp.AAC.1
MRQERHLQKRPMVKRVDPCSAATPVLVVCGSTRRMTYTKGMPEPVLTMAPCARHCHHPEC